MELVHDMPIYIPFRSVEEANEWQPLAEDPAYKPYMKLHAQNPILGYKIEEDLGGIETIKSGFLDVQRMLDSFREKVLVEGRILSDNMDYNHILISENGIHYGDVKASKIVFCEGYKGLDNPWFGWLPFKLTKGETISIEIPNHNPQCIFHCKRLFIMPDLNGSFRLGATYEHVTIDEICTSEAKNELLDRFNELYEDVYTVVNHKAAIRPTVTDRKPMIGVHPIHKQLYVFNGLGTKGVTLAPYLAEEFILGLESEKPISQEVDIKRFIKKYYKSSIER